MLRRHLSVHQARLNYGLFTACIRNEADHLWAHLRPWLCMVAPFACVSRRHIHDGTRPQGLRKFHYRMSNIETRGYSNQLKQSLPCGVRYVACHEQVASLLSFLQWCSDWCALGCSARVAFGCVCSSHVSGWLTSVEVFAAVPLGVPCFLVCGVGRYLVVRQNVGTQASCFIAAFGYRRPPRHARTSRALEVGHVITTHHIAKWCEVKLNCQSNNAQREGGIEKTTT